MLYGTIAVIDQLSLSGHAAWEAANIQNDIRPQTRALASPSSTR